MPRAVPDYSIADLERLNDLQLPKLENDDAVRLGLVAVGVIREWDLSLAVDIVLHGDLVFRAKLKGTGAGNDLWLAGKAAVATKFGEPSLLVKARRALIGAPADEGDGDHESLKFHGGSIPLRVAGEIVGTLTMSGEPDGTDHEAAVESIERYLGIAEVDGRHEV